MSDMFDDVENMYDENTTENVMQPKSPFPYIAEPQMRSEISLEDESLMTEPVGQESAEEFEKPVNKSQVSHVDIPETANFDPMTGEPIVHEVNRPKAPYGEQQVHRRKTRPRPTRSVSKQQKRKKKDYSTVKSVVGGTVGGMAASALLVLSLVEAGVLHVGGAVTTTSGDTKIERTITGDITPASEDMTVSEAVAAKCLPSVVSVVVSDSSGEGLGSGVVLDTKGNIITNWHVAGSADMISVKIGNDTYPAVLVGGDASSDIAVINIDPEGVDLVPIEVGDSSALVVGDWVMTLGSPLGLDQSASTGIVSALYRNTAMPSLTSSTSSTLYTNLIQVDAAINGGNSGGALVNDQGQLVGINTLYANQSGMESFSGIGFAIPGNYAVDIANKVIAGEKITHAYLGASCATVNEQNARANGLRVNYGAYVAEVVAGGPAEKAGLKVGDVIIQIGDTPIESADDYILAIRTHSQGETIKIKVNRGGEDVEVEATLDSDEELQKQQEKEQEEYQKWYNQQMQQMPQYQDTWPWNSYDQMFDFGF